MSFFEELKRRNVFRVGIAYAIAGWLLMQVTDSFVPALRLPEWFPTAVAFLLLIGFPVALFFAWAFEMTPDGIRREGEVEPGQSITPHTTRKLDRLIIIVLLIAVAVLLTERFTNTEVTVEPPAITATATDTQADKRISIAVLPFDNFSTDEENAFFAAGVHEDILTNLSRLSGLRVNSRTSVMQYANSQQNVKEIAQALGATFILEGSVRRSANQVRVTAQLIDAQNDVHLWAENYDRELTDIFAIQTAIASEIANALQTELSPVEEQLITARPTTSIEAYDYFLKARAVMQDSDTPSGFSDESVKLLESAVRIDPDYARAWALLAIAHGDYYWFRSDPSPQRLERMKRALDRAFELQPDLPEARLALATYYYRGFYDYPKALEQLERVRIVLPNDTLVHYNLGLTYRRLGQYDRSIRSFLDTTAIDPDHQEAWAEALSTATSSGRRAQALAMSEQLRRRFPGKPRMVAELAMSELALNGDSARAQQILDSIPETDHYYLWLARYQTALWVRDFRKAAAYAAQDKFLSALVPGWGQAEAARVLSMGVYSDEAAVLLEEAGRLLAVEITQPYAANFAWVHMAYAIYLVQSNQPEAAMQSCQRTREILPLEKDKVHGASIAATCAWVAGMAGYTDQALDDLERLLEQGWEMNYWTLAMSPEWDFLRENERFIQLLSIAKKDIAEAADP